MTELLNALSKFQDEQVFVKATKQGAFGKFAPMKDVVMDSRDKLKANGLSVHQVLTHIDGVSAVKTTLYHTSGEHIEDVTPITHKPEDPQKWGAAVTYTRRFAYNTILGLLVDTDDDGKLAASVDGKKNDVADFYEQKATLTRSLTKKGMTLDDISALVEMTLKKKKIETIADIEAVKAAAEK